MSISTKEAKRLEVYALIYGSAGLNEEEKEAIAKLRKSREAAKKRRALKKALRDMGIPIQKIRG